MTNFATKLPLMIISLLISLTLWLYVRVTLETENQTPTQIQLPVTSVNLPPGLVILDMPESVEFYPKGSDESIRAINRENLVAELDMSTARIGEGRYTVKLKYKESYDVTWDSREKVVAVTVDRLLTNQRVPVEVRATKKLRENTEYVYDEKLTTSDPATVSVSGPESLVKKISYARVVLDLSTVKAGEHYTGDQVTLMQEGDVPVNGKNLMFEPSRVTIYPGLKLAPTTRFLLVTPSFVGQPAFGYTVKRIHADPEQMEVSGSSDILSSYTTIATKPVNIEGLKATTTLVAEPNLPAGLFPTNSKQVKVTIIIEKTGSVAPVDSPPPTDNGGNTGR